MIMDQQSRGCIRRSSETSTCPEIAIKFHGGIRRQRHETRLVELRLAHVQDFVGCIVVADSNPEDLGSPGMRAVGLSVYDGEWRRRHIDFSYIDPLRLGAYLRSCLVVIVLLLFMTYTKLPFLDPFQFLLWPGLLLASVIFPEGVHSNWPYLYFLLATLINAMLWGGLLAFITSLLWKIFHSRSAR